MTDPRLDQLARLMLYHSIGVRHGDAFHVTADMSAMPLVKAILREAKAIGAFARVSWTDQEISRLLLELVNTGDDGRSESFLADMAECGIRDYQHLVGDIVIRAYVNDQELSLVSPAVRQLEAKAMKPFKDLVINHRKWVLFEYPTPARAQRAGLPFEHYSDDVLKVSSIDYARMQKQAAPLKTLMDKTDQVRITGPGTDLTFSIRNIPAIPCCGECNIPDGECFTAPVRDSACGTITFNTPSQYWGTTFSGIRLVFEQGRIVQATADQMTDKLNKILDTDEGARFLGEFALGFNPLISKPTLNTLFDEKIAGSFHLTPGACYDEAPNGNSSAIHWDLVMIQRPEYGGGDIWFDDVLVRRDGLFVLPELADLNP